METLNQSKKNEIEKEKSITNGTKSSGCCEPSYCNGSEKKS